MEGRRLGAVDNISVVVSIKKGAVIDVEASSYIDIVLRNYDIEGTEEEYLKVDDEGELYRETIW